MRLLFAGLCLGPLLLLPACETPTDPAEPVAIESLFPGDNEIGSWVRSADGIEVAKSDDEVTAMINGEAAPFIERGFVAYAVIEYTDGSNTLELRIWQMQSQAKAKDIYDNIVTEFGEYDKDWQEIDLGDAGRIVQAATRWWINARRSVYFVEVMVRPNDASLQAATEQFAVEVVGNIPQS